MYIKRNGKHSFTFFLNYDDVFVLYNGFAKADHFEIVGKANIKNKQQSKNIRFIYEDEGDFRCENYDDQFLIIYGAIEAENYLYAIDSLRQYEYGLFLGFEFNSLIYKEKQYSCNMYPEVILL